MKKIIILSALGLFTVLTVSYALVQGRENVNANIALETNADVGVNADVNANVNTDKNAGVTTSMNGNTSTSAGVPISSTSSSRESRSVTGGN